ncbi:hypothetical protein, partial [Vibrio vulnificus]|uniref:hypothetical protein n=1 Tax=Vibrio vulnificus TaxID=672 RepID=UPI003BF9C70D
MTLQNVLHVPKLACNLISVSKLAKDSNYSTKFFQNCCVFQDMESGRMIGNAKECDRLYIFNKGIKKDGQDKTAL